MRALPMLVAVCLAGPAHAEPQTPWGPHAGDHIFGINPYLEVTTDGWITPSLFGFLGPAPGWDFIAGGGAYLDTGSGLDGGFVEGLVRWFPRPEVALVGHVGWDAEAGAWFAPEVHLAVPEEGSLRLFAEVGVPILFSDGEVFGGANVLVAPEWAPGWWSLFLELHAEVWLADEEPVSLAMAPGAAVWFGPDRWHMITATVFVPATGPEPAVAFTLGYYVDFYLPGADHGP